MSSPPDWLKDFANQVAIEMRGCDVLPPLGCHYFYDDIGAQWEVTLFASSTIVVGGKEDGSIVASPFSVDLDRIQKLMTSISSLRWQPLPMGSDDDLGSHISVEGMFKEFPVWLRITATAPSQFSPGRIATVYAEKWQEVW